MQSARSFGKCLCDSLEPPYFLSHTAVCSNKIYAFMRIYYWRFPLRICGCWSG